MFPKSFLGSTIVKFRYAPPPDSRARILSREEEAELIERVQRANDRSAADALARARWPYVVKCALKYHRYGVAVDDLIAEGNVGLFHALGKFDAARGVRFVTYAQHWVRAFMLQHVLANWSIVTGGSRILHTRWFFRLRRERARVASALGEGEATEGALAERLGVKPEKVRQMLARLDARDLSLDAEASPNTGVRMVDLLPAAENQELGFFEREVRDSLKSTVERALATLSTRERYIVERRMMVEAGEAVSLADIGRTFGVSRERARQIEARAADKLRDIVMACGDPCVHEWLPVRREPPARPTMRRASPRRVQRRESLGEQRTG